MRRVFRTVLASLVGVQCVSGAWAQRSGRVTFNRPSDYGPSGAIDRVGGTFTGSSAAALSAARPTGSAASVRTGWRGAGDLGDVNYAPLTMGIGAQMLRFTPNPNVPVGSARFATRFDAATIDTGRITQADLSIASGFYTATSLATPLHGWRMTPPPVNFGVRTTLPSSARDAYQEVMGLKPADGDVGETQPVWSKLREMNARSRDATARRALELFRAGMYPEAGGALLSVRRADPSDAGASLLAAHAAIAQQQYSTAASLLLDAVRRRPTLLAERLDIRRSFGVPEEYDRQMRELSRIRAAPGSWESWVLKSYGAWASGDESTVRQMLARVREWTKDRDPGEVLALEHFSAALHASLAAP